MTDTPSDPGQTMALFRYGLIADLLHLPPGGGGLQQRLAEKAARDYTIPGSSRQRVAAETIRDWLKRYRKGGFDALVPKARMDRGQARGLPAEVAEQLLSIKEANPKLSVRLVIAQARASGQLDPALALPPSTVYRLLHRHALMGPRTVDPATRDRRRFAFERAGQLWTSDVMHGPSVSVDRRTRKTYLIAFLDDATRVVPYAAFALSENTQAFLPVFKQALLRRGYSERLYVDNGANYRSQQLALVCAKLGIALIHSRPYQPQGRGKIERWFKTVRAQFLTRLTAADTQTLAALNRKLWGWVEGDKCFIEHLSPYVVVPLMCWLANECRPHRVFPPSGAT